MNNDDYYTNDDNDWNDLTADIEDDQDNGLNCITNVIYSVNDDPHINNEYVDNPSEKLDFIDNLKQFFIDNNWIDQYIVNSTEFDVR